MKVNQLTSSRDSGSYLAYEIWCLYIWKICISSNLFLPNLKFNLISVFCIIIRWTTVRLFEVTCLGMSPGRK